MKYIWIKEMWGKIFKGVVMIVNLLVKKLVVLFRLIVKSSGRIGYVECFLIIG